MKQPDKTQCNGCGDNICPKCRGHRTYGIDCLYATMNPDIDYCECPKTEPKDV